jgi:hypothetical protein
MRHVFTTTMDSPWFITEKLNDFHAAMFVATGSGALNHDVGTAIPRIGGKTNAPTPPKGRRESGLFTECIGLLISVVSTSSAVNFYWLAPALSSAGLIRVAASHDQATLGFLGIGVFHFALPFIVNPGASWSRFHHSIIDNFRFLF